MKKVLLPLFGAFLLVISSFGQDPAATPAKESGTDSTKADNTKRNAAEPNKNTDTAEKQSNSKDDLTLTQKIRQAVIADGSLSMNAKNVKIITRNGKVTLKGPVDSQQEKDTIGAKSQEVAGKENTDNQLEVKADKK
jgi:hyperosmotically inducible protein